MISIEIDKQSGFCYGVINAIKKAEREMGGKEDETLYCLGDIVHNSSEVNRLEKMGMQTINYEKFHQLKNKKVLFRAHGEPPKIYEEAKEKGFSIVDATCPVVLQLQKRIRECYTNQKETNKQIVIFGKRGHAEVNGLVGQTNGEAIVIQHKEELQKLDFSKPIYLFSQTTMPLDIFDEVVQYIKENINEGVSFKFADTICRQVALRIPHIKEFARLHNKVFFIAGKESSNGKVLYLECKSANPDTFFLTSANELEDDMLFPLKGDESIGICGATSTPMWQMKELAKKIKEKTIERGYF